MAEQSFPQIPSTVWWGVRTQLQRTPRAKFDDSMLAATLGVQPAAAKQYILELRRVGILDEDGKGTDLASRWRMPETYQEAVNEIATSVFPEGLVTIAPPGSAERQKVINWFMNQGLGEGSAKNKAATYLLITSGEPGPTQSNSPKTSPVKNGSNKETATRTSNPNSRAKPAENGDPARAGSKDRPDDASLVMPLNVNVQIHISADASSDQIDSIFSAMKKYLRND